MTDTQVREPGVHALLSDGETVLIRPAGPVDHEGLLRLYGDMSGENLRLRFFGTSSLAGEQAAGWVLAPPRRGHCGLVALHGDRIIGVAEYEVTSDPTVAEISLAVADDFHHRGRRHAAGRAPRSTRPGRPGSRPSPPTRWPRTI